MFYPQDLCSYLKTIVGMDYFKAEAYLEEEMIKGYTKELTSLKIEEPSFNLKYARLQGQIEALRELSAKRKVITARSEHSGSVNKGE